MPGPVGWHATPFPGASVRSCHLRGDLYSAPASAVDYELVRAFVLSAEEADLFSESLTFEAKEKRNGSNVAEAVAALSNTDGGGVLVGVKDKDATGGSPHGGRREIRA
jgi:hypothetical protein